MDWNETWSSSNPIEPKTQKSLDAHFNACNDGTCSQGPAACYVRVRGPGYSGGIGKDTWFEGILRNRFSRNLHFFEVHSILDEDHSAKEAVGIVSQTLPESEPQVEAALQLALDAWWGFLDGVEAQRHPVEIAVY